MKKLTVLLVIIYHSNLFAGGFSFIPKKNIFAGDIEIIKAKVKLSQTGLEYSCLVDTGARFTMFKETVLKDFQKVGETIGGGISNSSQTTDLVRVDLELGDWTASGAVVGRTDRIPFDCLIGNDFFLNRNFKIDFTKNRFTDLDNVTELDQSFPLNVYRSDSGGHFGFEMVLAQKTVETIFDTGADSTVVSLSFVNEHPEHFKLIKEIDVTDGNNAKLKAGLYEIDEISFGSTTLKKGQVYVLDLANLKNKLPNVEIILGLNVIQKYNWQFDTQSRRYYYLSK